MRDTRTGAQFWPWCTEPGTRPTWTIHLSANGRRYLWQCTTAVSHPELGRYPRCEYWDTALTQGQAAADAAGHAASHDADAAELRRRLALRPPDTRVKPDLPEAHGAVLAIQDRGPACIQAIAEQIQATAQTPPGGGAPDVDLAYLAVSLRRLDAQSDLRSRIANSWRERTGWPCPGSPSHELLWATPELDAQWLRQHSSRSPR